MLIKEALSELLTEITKMEDQVRSKLSYINNQAGYDLVDPACSFKGIAMRITSLLNQDRILNKEIK